MRKLAIAVIERALTDATAKHVPLTLATEARRFLLLRNDLVTRLWFTAAGLNIQACRERWLKYGLQIGLPTS